MVLPERPTLKRTRYQMYSRATSEEFSLDCRFVIMADREEGEGWKEKGNRKSWSGSCSEPDTRNDSTRCGRKRKRKLERISEVGDLDAIYDRPFRYSWKEGRAASTQESFLSQREVEILSELNAVLDPLIYSIQSLRKLGKPLSPLGIRVRNSVGNLALPIVCHLAYSCTFFSGFTFLASRGKIELSWDRRFLDEIPERIDKSLDKRQLRENNIRITYLDARI